MRYVAVSTAYVETPTCCVGVGQRGMLLHWTVLASLSLLVMHTRSLRTTLTIFGAVQTLTTPYSTFVIFDPSQRSERVRPSFVLVPAPSSPGPQCNCNTLPASPCITTRHIAVIAPTEQHQDRRGVGQHAESLTGNVRRIHIPPHVLDRFREVEIWVRRI